MSSSLLASKIVITEEDPKIRSITGVNPSVVGFVGVTEKGPVGDATLVNSVAEYDAVFGGYVANGEVRQAVDGFFQNGGTQLYITRVVHYTDPTAPATKTSAAGTISLNNSATPTPAPSLQVDGKYDGTYAGSITIKISDATSGVASEFNLQVLKSGVIIETFANLTMDNTADRWVETIVNDVTTGSKYIKVTDLNVGATVAEERPANVTSTALTGGNDGLTGLVDADYVGASSTNGKTGIRCFDLVPDLSVLAVPGVATSAVHNALITYCETTRERAVFAVLDPPSGNSATQIVTYVNTTAAIGGLSEQAAIYWPRIKVLNPSTTVFGKTSDGLITVPPSGYICGVYARNDQAKPGGVYVPPAGVEHGVIFGCLGFETTECLEEEKRDVVYPQRINPLTALRGGPRHIDGTRTLKANGNFPSVSERRGAIYIEQSIKDGLQFARHQNNTEQLRQSVARSCEAFLRIQMKNGAFRSNDPAKAFFVDFGDALNPPSVQFAGQLIGRIGIATAKPTDWIIVRFSQDTRALDEELAA